MHLHLLRPHPHPPTSLLTLAPPPFATSCLSFPSLPLISLVSLFMRSSSFCVLIGAIYNSVPFLPFSVLLSRLYSSLQLRLLHSNCISKRPHLPRSSPRPTRTCRTCALPSILTFDPHSVSHNIHIFPQWLFPFFPLSIVPPLSH